MNNSTAAEVTAVQMREQIKTYIHQYRYVTFIELAKHVDGFTGDRALCVSPGENTILWTDMSQLAVDVMIDLIWESKEIFPHPASRFTYLIDGCTLRLPLAKRPPAAGYKKPHWLPVCFCTFPFDKKIEKRRQKIAKAEQRNYARIK